jgi:hypothetical protein
MEVLTGAELNVVTNHHCPEGMVIVVGPDGWHVIKGRQHRFFTTDQVQIMKMRVTERIELDAATEEALSGAAAG